jgi:hypothetical protein
LKGQKPGIKAAPENVHISGLEQIGKDLAVAAFSAQAAGGKRKSEEAEFLEQLVNAVAEIQDNNQTLQEFLEKKLNELLRTLGFTAWEAFENWLINNASLLLTGNGAEARRGMDLDRRIEAGRDGEPKPPPRTG